MEGGSLQIFSLHFSVSNGGKDVMKVEEPYLQQPPQHAVRSWSDQASDVGPSFFSP